MLGLNPLASRDDMHRLQAHNINVGEAKHARISYSEHSRGRRRDLANTHLDRPGLNRPAEIAGGIDVARPLAGVGR